MWSRFWNWVGVRKRDHVKTAEKGVDRQVDILHTLGFPMEGWPSG